MQSVGDKVNIAQFGTVAYWTGADALAIEEYKIKPKSGKYEPVNVPEQGGWHLGVSWEAPRQFYSVIAQFAQDSRLPDVNEVKLQYWRHNWPATWSGGWTHIDDPYNGRWVTAFGDVAVEKNTWTFTFDPLDMAEMREAEDFAVSYRQSFRFRLLFKDGSGVAISNIEAYSNSVWCDADLKIEFPETQLAWQGKLDVFNGYVLSIDDKDKKSVLVKVRYADCHKQVDPYLLPIPPDRTIMTVDGGAEKVSFLATDALEAPIWVKDLGVYIRKSDDPELAEWKKEVEKQPLPIFDRILTEPEQSYERASKEIPQLVKIRQSRYVPLGCDANRQEFALRFNGDIYMDKVNMKNTARDNAKLLWPGKRITYKFPTGDPIDFREREDAVSQSAMNGYLPIYTSEWKDREFVFTRTDFACYLDQTPYNEEKKRGDEPLVVFSKLKIRNTTEDKRTARYWFVIEPAETLEYRDGFIYSTGRVWNENVPISVQAVETRWVSTQYESPRMRAEVRTNGKGAVKSTSCTYEPSFINSLPNAVAYDVELEPRKSHEIEIVMPFITFTGENGKDVVRKLDYDKKLAETVDYWEKLIAEGGIITTPEPIINDFVKATIPHIAITVDKDIDSGYYLLPAGTYSYNVCANEACHQIRSLDMRGHHDQALKYLQPYLDCQGSRGMHGKFKSAEGVLHGLKVAEDRDYQTFNYNLDHGFVHFALCEHYFLTRDKAWAEKIAPNLISACDFVTRERQYTMKKDENGEKVWEYGLIPPGHLEDNPEWLYWNAVNSYCYRGMAETVKVLEEIGHPDAARIKADTQAYREDLRRSMQISMDRSPVTQLADGTYQPFEPSRCHLRGRDLGWIRDSLYGSIHSIECGVLDPDEDMSKYILKDAEDNLFVSRYRGRQVDLEKFWFSQGGNTIQSGLLPIVMIYLKRNQPEHAIRSLYNSLSQNLYADVRCFTEHPVAAYGLGIGPFYKTPDENCWINWLRHVMLSERGHDEMEIAPGAPRAWFEPGKTFEMNDVATYFGKMSYKITSDTDKIVAQIDPPVRNAPKSLIVHFRHPQKKQITSVTVDGKDYKKFDPSGAVTLPGLCEKMEIVVRY